MIIYDIYDYFSSHFKSRVNLLEVFKARLLENIKGYRIYLYIAEILYLPLSQ